MQPEREIDHRAEVATGAAERPEEIGILVLGSTDDLAAGGHDGGADQVVERQSVQADEVADAAAECQAADAGVAKGAARGREAVTQAGGIEVFPQRPAAAGRRPRLWIDRDAAHQPQVDDEPALADAVAGDAVAATANGDGQIPLAGERDRGDDVVDIERPDDQLRTPVDHPVEREARGVVARVLRVDHGAAMALPEIHQDGCGHRVSMTQTEGEA